MASTVRSLETIKQMVNNLIAQHVRKRPAV